MQYVFRGSLKFTLGTVPCFSELDIHCFKANNHRTCLRRVLRRFWPNHLSNEELYEATGSTPVSALVRVRRWRWIEHILRTSPSNISRSALTWAPEGKRRRTRPAERNVEKNCGKRKEPAGMAFVGGCGRIGGRTGWMAQSSGRP